MAFLALEKTETFSNIHLRSQEVIGGHVHWTEKTLGVQSKPEGTVETVSLKMRQVLSLLHKFDTEKNFLMPSQYKKIMPAQQPIRACILL